MLSYLVYEVFVQAFIQNFYPTKEELEKFKTNLLVYLANEHMLVPRPASMLTRDEVLDYYAKNLDLIQSKISPDQFSAKEMKVMKQHIAQQLEKLSWGFALRRDYKYGSFGE